VIDQEVTSDTSPLNCPWFAFLFTVAFAPLGLAIAQEEPAATTKGHGAAEIRIQSGNTIRAYKAACWFAIDSPDGKTLATGSADRVVRPRDVASLKAKAALRGHTGAVNFAANSPDGKHLVSGSSDGEILAWDPANGMECARLTGHIKPVRTVAFSPDGKTPAGAGVRQAVQLFDSSTGQVRTALAVETNARPVTFSPDGQFVAAGLYSGEVVDWDVATGEFERSLPGQKALVYRIVLAPDGKSIN